MTQPQPLHVLVTRPAPQGEKLSDALRAQGDRVTYLPTISFVSADKNAMQEALLRVPTQDCLIFISPHAVKSGLRAMGVIPVGVKIAAIGEGTAKALHALGYESVFFPKRNANSEALLAEPYLQQVSGKKIMLVKGEGGRDLLERELSGRGAVVSQLIAYKRVAPSIDLAHFLDNIKKHPLDVMMITSCDSLTHFKEMIGEDAFLLIKNTPFIVVSDRIKSLALQLGIKTIWLANSANQASLLACLEEKRNVLWKMK